MLNIITNKQKDAETKDVVEQVMDILSSSTRSFPAHFTSNGERKQSFCVDFDINEDDEYDMASNAWYELKEQSAIRTGEDVMLAAYLVVKLGGNEDDICKLQDIILKQDLQEIPNLQEQNQYLQYCADYGKKKAKASI